MDHLWTTRLQQLAIRAPTPAFKQQLTFEKLKTKERLVKGIDKRTHKDGIVSYRARVRIKGHPSRLQIEKGVQYNG